MIRPATPSDISSMWSVINDAAMAYKGVIPADRWHEPYMPLAELQAEIANGVRFSVCEEQAAVMGCMGIQDVQDAEAVARAQAEEALGGSG